MELRELLDKVGDDLEEDVRTAVRAHPDYVAAVQHLVSLGIAEAIRLASGAVT